MYPLNFIGFSKNFLMGYLKPREDLDPPTPRATCLQSTLPDHKDRRGTLCSLPSFEVSELAYKHVYETIRLKTLHGASHLPKS